jgi:hypothetical protein
MQLQNKHDTDDRWIFERNPDTGEIFKRKCGDYDSPRELVNPEINSVPNIKTENMKMISLYDYLGHAAGSDLGKQVAIAASKAGIKSEIREVKHVGYSGPIMLYPRTFLDNFFGGGLNESTSGKQLLKG